MDTGQIMKLALKLAGIKTVPEDSAILVKGENIKKVLFGIDIGVPELLLAKQMHFEAVIAHHPMGGTAALGFHGVFKRHIQQMVDAGIPETEAKKVVNRKLEQLEVEDHTRNYGHVVDVARLMKIPCMNVHTPLDEMGRRTMSNKVSSKTGKHSRVRDIVDALNELPEFKKALTKIEVRLGRADAIAGEVVVSHGAGTNGGYDIARAYFEHGVRTLIYIHVSPSDLEKLKADNMGNLVVTGHIASDSVGINPFIHALEEAGVSVTTIDVVRD